MNLGTWSSIAVVALLSISGAGSVIPPSSATSSSPNPTFAHKIDHVVIIMMENHAYDNYFNSYCLQASPICNGTGDGVAPGTCVAQLNVTGGCVTPYNFTAMNFTTPDMPHEYDSTIHALDGGKENGYYSAEKAGLEPFGHYNGSTLPVYWDLAQEFAIGDNFFSSALSYSLPNHWYLLAGEAPPSIVHTGTASWPTPLAHTYLNQSNSTKTVEDLLNASHVGWKYYDWPLVSYQDAIQLPPSGHDVNNAGNGSAYAFWNPLAAKAESYDTYLESHFVMRTQFFTDVQRGKLPSVSYVIPQGSFSDHPPANVTLGESFIANVVDTIEFSKYWNNTAIFLTWDEYGGWYDNVAPPSLDPLGLSSRVPFLVISPYTPEGLVVHSLGYFESTLAFLEDRWNMPCLTSRDCNAPSLSPYFDFSMQPRAPVFINPDWEDDTYPYHYEPYEAVALNTTEWTGADNPAIDEDTD
jgi:phospholipase C